MTKVHFILVAVLLAIELAASHEPVKRKGFTYIGSATKQTKNASTKAIYYYLSNDRANWTTAFTSCNMQRGLLATPLNPVLDADLRAFMIPNSSDLIWLGARVISRTWIWETVNFAIQWSNFLSPICSTAQPDSCLLALRQNGTWGWCYNHCNYSNRYVCQFE